MSRVNELNGYEKFKTSEIKKNYGNRKGLLKEKALLLKPKINSRKFCRGSPSQRLESDQLYPEDYSYHGGGYFNPLESSTPMQTRNSPLFRTSGHQATLPRANAGMYQAVNPLKDYGYPSDYGLPMTSLTSSNGFITANPLSEFDEDLEAASVAELASQQQLAQPQTSSRLQMNLSHSSTGTNSDGTTSTLSPQSRATLTGGQLSSSGIGGDLSAASGMYSLQDSFH